MLLNILSGLVNGYAEGQQTQLNQEQAVAEKKLKIKMFQRQLDMEDEAKAAKDQLLQLLTPVLEQLGGPEERVPLQGRTLKDVLGTPEGQVLAIKSGTKLDDIRQFQQPSLTETIAAIHAGNATGGAIGMPPGGGMELTGVKVGPNGQVMPDFARPKFKGEVPSGDGASMIRVDEYGREIGRRPMAPSERKPPEQTGGQKATDSKFAEEYVTFKAAGGYADVEKSLLQLEEAKAELEKGGLTGPVRGNTPDLVRQFANPKSLAVRDQVEEVVQRNLRLILGAQFTEKEGERLIARAYNEKMSDAENVKRVGRLIEQIKTAALAKQEAIDYFEKNGTLTGFKGKLWTLADFSPDKEKPSLKGPGGSPKPRVVDFSQLPP